MADYLLWIHLAPKIWDIWFLMTSNRIWVILWASQVVLAEKNLPANAGNWSLITGTGRSPGGEGTATHLSILAWRIPWTEKLCGLQSIGSQRAGLSWNNLACTHAHTLLTFSSLACMLWCPDLDTLLRKWTLFPAECLLTFFFFFKPQLCQTPARFISVPIIWIFNYHINLRIQVQLKQA